MTPKSSIEQQILDVLEGTASQADRDAVAAWRTSGPENERRFREIQEVWRAAAKALQATPSSMLMIVPRPTADELLGEGLRRDVAQRSRSFRSARESPAHSTALRRNRFAQAIAAGLAAVGLVSAAWLALDSRGSGTLKIVELATGEGELAIVSLDDGSTVRLAPHSQLRALPDHARGVTLHGRAYFAVAHVEGESFVVRTAAGDVEVLGTRFDLQADGESSQVTVVEGTVVVSGGGEQIVVGTDQVSTVLRGRPPSAPVPADVAGTLEWMGRVLIFEATAMDQIARELERAYGMDVSIASPLVAGRTVSGVFRNDEFEPVATAICEVIGARCTLSETQLIIDSPK